MNNKEITYSIQQVSEMTGISKQLIRKWEDRYGLIQPQRLDNGYRMYSVAELKLLKAVKKLIQNGHSVKQAVNIVQSPGFKSEDFLNEEPSITDLALVFLNDLEVAGAISDDKKILHTLQQAHHTLGVQHLLDDVVVPFLWRIGELWGNQSWVEYQEAIASQTVRDFLANLRRGMYVPEDAPLVIGSCLPGEYHEIPLHILLVQCSMRGYRTMMLGQSPAPNAIESIVDRMNPSYVLLSASTDAPLQNGLNELKTLDQFASKKTNTLFLLGGAAAMNTAEQITLNAILLSKNSLDKIL